MLSRTSIPPIVYVYPATQVAYLIEKMDNVRHFQFYKQNLLYQSLPNIQIHAEATGDCSPKVRLPEPY